MVFKTHRGTAKPNVQLVSFGRGVKSIGWLCNRLNLFCCLIFTLSLASPSMALGSHRLAAEYIRTDFTVDDGLPDNVVNEIVQTANGLLWVGTASGLASFDGREFSPVNIRVPGSPAQGAVNRFVEAPNGDLWIGTDAGVVLIPRVALDQFDPAKLTFYQLGSRATNKVAALIQTRGGGLWAGSDHGLFRQEDGRFVPVIQELPIFRIFEASDGHLLLITSRGFLEWDGRRIIEHPGLAASLGVRDDEIFDVFQDRSGATWYCTARGIARQVGRSFDQIDPLYLSKKAAYRAYEDAQGGVWFVSRSGLYRATGDLLETPAPGLLPRAVFVDKEGGLWVGTNGSGLVNLKPHVVRMFTTADGLASDIAMTVLSSHDGKVWVGGNCGLSVFDGKNFKAYQESDGLLNTCVWTLAEDRKHNLWIGTYGAGLFRFRDGHFVQYSVEQGLVSKIVYQIIVARDDSLWIATLDGISHMKDGHIRNYSAADGLSSNQVLSVYQDHGGDIWAQTQGGLDRLAGERFVPFSSAQPRDGPSPVSLAEDSLGDLYTADSPRGISLIQDGKLTRLNEDLQVLGMVESTEHDLWFSGRNGIIRIPLNELKRSVNDHDAPLNYALFDRSDGLNSMQCSAGAPNMAITTDDKLWVATVKGLAMIDLARLPRTSRKPKVFVGAVTIGKDKVLAGQQLFLAPGAHHIELHLQAVDLASPKKIRLQYRMDGVDANWLDADASRTAIYTTIPPGIHHLHVRATSGDGVWDRVGVVYDVTQRPYFYQTYWFYVLCIGFAMFCVWGAYRLRLRSIEARIKERTEERADERVTIARDLHDTLLQGVQGLILRFHAVARELPEATETRQQLDQALALAESVLVDSRDRVAYLRSSVVDLAQSLAGVGSGMKYQENIHFVVSTEGTVSPLRNAVQEELFFIGREAITNAFRHASAKEIVVKLIYTRANVCLICRDDGRGLQRPILGAGRAEGHWGMLGMRERAERIGADFECWSEPGGGTEIKVCLNASHAYASHRARLFGMIKRMYGS